MPPSTTQQVFDAYTKQYDYFNRELFGGKLPDCLLNFSRKRDCMGLLRPSRWDREGISSTKSR